MFFLNAKFFGYSGLSFSLPPPPLDIISRLCKFCTFQVIIKINSWIEKYKQASKVSFTNEYFRKRKMFFTISKVYINVTRNIIKKFFEIHFEHLGSSHPFWWNFFETYNSDVLKALWIWSFWQKIVFFRWNFFLTLPIFLAGNRQSAKKFSRKIRSIPNPTEKVFWTHPTKNERKNRKNEPSPVESRGMIEMCWGQIMSPFT